MKFKVFFLNTCESDKVELLSIDENYYQIIFLSKSIVSLQLLKRYQHFLDHHIYSHYIKYYFEFFPFHINSICILVNKLIVVASISVTKARWINFEIANDLKTTVLPSIVKFLSFHNFKIF